MKNIADFRGLLVLALLWTCLIIPGSAVAFTHQEALTADPVIALFLKPGNTYPLVIEKIRRFEESQNDHFKQIIQQTFDSVPSMLKGRESGEIESFFKQAIDFSEQKLFQPTGNLWFSISGDLMPYLMWEANAKPRALYEFVKRFGVLPIAPVELNDEAVVFRFLPVPGRREAMALEFRTNGLYVKPVAPILVKPAPRWDDFKVWIEKPDAVLALEIDLRRLLEITVRWRTSAGTRVFPDPRFHALERARIFVSRQGGQGLIAVSDPSRRERMKNLCQALLKRVQDLPSGLQPHVGSRNVMDRLKLVENGEWVGIGIDNVDPAEMIFAGKSLWHLSKGLIMRGVQKLGYRWTSLFFCKIYGWPLFSRLPS